MADPRTDPGGRTALLGCGVAMTLLVGLLFIGVLAYIGSIIGVRTSVAYHSTLSAIEAHESPEPVLGPPLSHSMWLGLQLARSSSDQLELRVRSSVTGELRSGTVYSTYALQESGLVTTSVLLAAKGTVMDVLDENAKASDARIESRRGSILDEANAMFTSRRFAEALLLANEAIELDPDNPDAHALRSRAHLELDDLPAAERDARHAMSLEPEHGGAMRALAHVHRGSENWDACIEVATRRIRASPRDGAAWTIRSRCFLGTGKRREAVAGFREACALDDSEGCQLARSLQ